jgi:hypothetical protein
LHPVPERVDAHEEVKAAGKEYEFHRYDGAGHGFIYSVRRGDIVGVVEAVASGVDPSLVGTRVLVDPAFYDALGHPIGLLGSEADGGFAELVVVEHARVHDVAGSPLSDEELACLPVAYGTCAMAVVWSSPEPWVATPLRSTCAACTCTTLRSSDPRCTPHTTSTCSPTRPDMGRSAL